MIITELYKGQGFGNQLWCYVTTRVLSRKLGYDFGIQNSQNFKGNKLMNIDFGKSVGGGSGPEGGPPEALPHNITDYYLEMARYDVFTGSDVRTFDHKLLGINDKTKIDGCLQDETLLRPFKNEIREWIKMKNEQVCRDFSDENTCVINWRGSGYIADKDFFLSPAYYENAIGNMQKINPDFQFIVITEDPDNAKLFFPKYPVYHFSLEKDYAIIASAKSIILSNSSFAWFPTWLNTGLKNCIAPKYWGRHNISDGYWSLGYNITPGWTYQDRTGKLFTAEQCQEEWNLYMKDRPDRFIQTDKPIKVSRVRKQFHIFRVLSSEQGLFVTLKNMLGLFMAHIAYKCRDVMTMSKSKPANTNANSNSTTADSSVSNHPSWSLSRKIKAILIRQSYY